jgi:hypothetical protein
MKLDVGSHYQEIQGLLETENATRFAFKVLLCLWWDSNLEPFSIEADTLTTRPLSSPFPIFDFCIIYGHTCFNNMKIEYTEALRNIRFF